MKETDQPKPVDLTSPIGEDDHPVTKQQIDDHIRQTIPTGSSFVHRQASPFWQEVFLTCLRETIRRVGNDLIVGYGGDYELLRVVDRIVMLADRADDLHRQPRESRP